MDVHTCARCKETKPRIDFPLGNKVSWCKSCYMADHQRRRESLMFELDGVIRSGLQIRRKYKMSPEAYIAIYNSQNGLCAICHTKPEDKLLVVDHNHDTNQVRELLCDHCNWMIGHARESIDVLISATNYLEKHNV